MFRRGNPFVRAREEASSTCGASHLRAGLSLSWPSHVHIQPNLLKSCHTLLANSSQKLMRLLQAFIQGVCRPSRPLVILFLVDYQWVDNTSSGAIVAAREPHNTCVCEFFICGDQSHPEGSALLFQPNLLLAHANTYPELKNSPRPSAALGLVVLRRPNNPAPRERGHERRPDKCVNLLRYTWICSSE